MQGLGSATESAKEMVLVDGSKYMYKDVYFNDQNNSHCVHFHDITSGYQANGHHTLMPISDLQKYKNSDIIISSELNFNILTIITD